MPEMKTLNGYEVVDAKAREDIEVLKNAGVDLSEYAKKSEIPDVSDFITSIPSEYITESELNAKGYLTQHQDLSEYAKKSEIPTRISQLENNRGYTTTQYVDQYVDAAIAEAIFGENVDELYTNRIETLEADVAALKVKVEELLEGGN
jgi:hypothetical protein